MTFTHKSYINIKNLFCARFYCRSLDSESHIICIFGLKFRCWVNSQYIIDKIVCEYE